ncbi:MAG TPA: CBS domain-containing protein [Myxococcaceae bacterium]|nr:CBS domain-containing protein [Myxococcaceae bacterium]
MDEMMSCGIRTVVVYGPQGPQRELRTVHCPAGNDTVALEHCEHCRSRMATVAEGDAPRSHLACRVAAGHPGRVGLVSEVMPRTVVAVRPELRADAMLLALVEHDRGGAPVVDQACRPIGMVSITDLLDEYERMRRMDDQTEESAPRPRLVSDVMSPGAFTISDGATVDEALAELRRRQVKRLVVVGDRGALVGVVTALDLLRACPPPSRSSGPAVAAPRQAA